MPSFKPLTCSMKETLNLGTVEGKTQTATVSFAKMGASADATIWDGLVAVLGDCQQYPVSMVKNATTSLLEQ